MVTFTQKSCKQSDSGPHATRNSTISIPEHASRTAPTALAVAVNHALKASWTQPYRYLLAATLMGVGPLAHAQGFPASIKLSDLDGSNGFLINGIGSVNFSFSRISVSGAGDINGDGVDDVIIGSPDGESTDGVSTGKSYVVFGDANLGSGGLLQLSGLDGRDGFSIDGIDDDDESGNSVSAAGDVNGDGVDDVIISAPGAHVDFMEFRSRRNGQSYVLFGAAGLGQNGSLELSSLDGNNGFVINGRSSFDYSGDSVSGAGDINGDGVADVIIGASNGKDGRADVGQSYVVFGGAGVGRDGPVNTSSLDGTDGFVLNGVDDGFYSGVSVSGAGDINGDGIDDFIIGGPNAEYTLPSDCFQCGESYVVFGGADAGEDGFRELSGLDGDNGFVISGAVEDEGAGRYVSGGGDINGDGVADLVIGSARGQAYVVFGGAGVGRVGSLSLSNLNGSNGFVIEGEFAAVSHAGDINGDGVDDVLIGVRATSSDANSTDVSHVIFGGGGVGSGGLLKTSELNGENGFTLNGIDSFAVFNTEVSSAGDVNGDGIDDVIIAAYAFGDREPEVYVVFGSAGIPVGPVTPEPPANDQFVNAESLVNASQALAADSTLTVNGTTVGATIENDESAHHGGTPGPMNSVWYRWTAETDQVVEFDTVGSELGTVLAAYTGDNLLEINALAQAIDNRGKITRIRFAARAGETYHIAVDGYGKNSEGVIQLNVRQPTMDPDECTITGTDGPDELTGTSGADVICGLGGADKIRALGGADIIFAGNGQDFVSAGGGKDMVFGENGNDLLSGGSGIDLLVGGRLSDRIFGGKGDDIVFGGQGADRLFGAEGDDALFGEMGADRLFGGEDNDYLDGGLFIDVCFDKDGVNTSVNCEPSR